MYEYYSVPRLCIATDNKTTKLVHAFSPLLSGGKQGPHFHTEHCHCTWHVLVDETYR